MAPTYGTWRSRLFENLGAEAAQRARIIAASIIGCIVTLQMGAFSVVLETTLSGITELPFSAFCGLMLPIHLAIGLVEGLITAAVLTYVYAVRPELLRDVEVSEEVRSGSSKSLRTVIITLAVAVVVVGGIFSHFASSNPDGLEWALFGNEEAGYSANMGLQSHGNDGLRNCGQRNGRGSGTADLLYWALLQKEELIVCFGSDGALPALKRGIRHRTTF